MYIGIIYYLYLQHTIFRVQNCYRKCFCIVYFVIYTKVCINLSTWSKQKIFVQKRAPLVYSHYIYRLLSSGRFCFCVVSRKVLCMKYAYWRICMKATSKKVWQLSRYPEGMKEQDFQCGIRVMEKIMEYGVLNLRASCGVFEDNINTNFYWYYIYNKTFIKGI